MAWTATLGTPTTQGGNILATITFNNPQTGETIKQTYPGNDLTPAAVKQLAQNFIASLQARDAALPLLQPGLISLT